MKEHERFMKVAIQLAMDGMLSNNGGPFGAVVVRNGEIIGRGSNKVSSSNDPTAHAEIVAIRDACKNLGHFQLNDCVIYTSCEPCPMCLGAIYWARPKAIYYACNRNDAAAIGFDDDFIYREIEIPHSERKIPAISILRKQGLAAFEEWKIKQNKTVY
jgi:tRNA(Arg) A34 adenosine deaminase TadA